MIPNLTTIQKVCYASEYSTVDPKKRLMEMKSKNMSFCNFVNMEEKMTYTPDPENPSRTLMRQETVVTVQGVPLTSYMEGIIVNTVSSNSSKGRAAIEWIVEKLGSECRCIIISHHHNYIISIFSFSFFSSLCLILLTLIHFPLFEARGVLSPPDDFYLS